MESRSSSKRVFPFRRNLLRRNSSTRKMWILRFKIFSRTDGFKIFLIKDRRIGSYQDLAPGGEHFPKVLFVTSDVATLCQQQVPMIDLQPGEYFVCTRPDLAPSMTSAQTPLHLRHLYHQVVEFSHVSLPLGWTSSPRIWTSVMRRSNKGSTNHRGHAPRHGHRPCVTPGLL